MAFRADVPTGTVAIRVVDDIEVGAFIFAGSEVELFNVVDVSENDGDVIGLRTMVQISRVL
jgi:hypothetical protein